MHHTVIFYYPISHVIDFDHCVKDFAVLTQSVGREEEVSAINTLLNHNNVVGGCSEKIPKSYPGKGLGVACHEIS